MPDNSPYSISEKNTNENEREKYKRIDVATEQCAAQSPCLTPAKVCLYERPRDHFFQL